MKNNHLQILIDKINTSSSNAYGNAGYNHLLFLKECNDHLFEYFQSHFKSKLNFSALSYRKIDEHKMDFDFIGGIKPVGSYNFNEKILGHDTMRGMFEEFIQEAKESRTINLTYVLTEQVKDHEVFLAYSNKNQYEGVNEDVNLGKIIFKEHIDDFININIDYIKSLCLRLKGDLSEFHKYGRYLWHYKRIIDYYTYQNPNRPFYLYFVRPSALVSDYRILLSLSTSVPLSSNTIAKLNLILHRIISQTALEKFNIELLTQNQQLESGVKIIKWHKQELEHRVKGQFSILKGLLYTIKKKFPKNESVVSLLSSFTDFVARSSDLNNFINHVQGNEVGRIDLNYFLGQLCIKIDEYIQNFKKGSKIVNNYVSGGESITIEEARLLSFIINELVVNSLKHGGYKESEKIPLLFLSLEYKEQYSYHLKYSDNGLEPESPDSILAGKDSRISLGMTIIIDSLGTLNSKRIDVNDYNEIKYFNDNGLNFFAKIKFYNKNDQNTFG